MPRRYRHGPHLEPRESVGALRQCTTINAPQSVRHSEGTSFSLTTAYR